jgi:hypothetical protein
MDIHDKIAKHLTDDPDVISESFEDDVQQIVDRVSVGAMDVNTARKLFQVEVTNQQWSESEIDQAIDYINMYYPFVYNVFGAGWKPTSVFSRIVPRIAPTKPGSIVTPETDAVFKIDNFDWDEFTEDLENVQGDISLEDFSDRGNIVRNIELYSKGPLPDIANFIDEANKSNAIEEHYPKFYSDVEDKVTAAGEFVKYWEHEEATQPTGYHGNFESIYVLIELEDINVEEIIDLEQYEDNRIHMTVVISAPSKTKGWQSDHLA